MAFDYSELGFGKNSWNERWNDFKEGFLDFFDFSGARAADKTNSATAALQEDAQAFNAREAQTAREWDKMMSDTQYQRAVADLKEAGLNPWLLANGGQAAPAVSASAASSSAGSGAQVNNKVPAILAAVLAFALKNSGSAKKAASSVKGANKVVNNYFYH